MGEVMHNYSFDGDDFIVLVNDEHQHCLWPSSQAIPAGWMRIGPQGSKAACLEFIEASWTDMRPKSLQEAMGR
jgi:MbtH protein